MTIAANLGYPRIGPGRELKHATEGYWSGGVSLDELRETGAELRRRNWKTQEAAGIDHVPSNDFSFYDHVLDTAALFGVVPRRYGWDGGGPVDLDTLFAMARGAQTDELDVQALGMTKWFDTNYHYIVPELAPGQQFEVSSTKPFDEFEEAKELGIVTRPVLLGPVSFLALSKCREPGVDLLSEFLVPLTEAYCEVLRRLGDLGAGWVQLDEPCLVADMMPDRETAALEGAYARMARDSGDARLMVQTYFGDLGRSYPLLTRMDVDGVGLDFVRGDGNLELLREHGFPGDKHLSAGVVDGRNVWIDDFDASLRLLEELADVVGRDRLMVSPSCSLLHVPLDASRETELDSELRSWLSFARQKLSEVSILTRALDEGREAVRRELEANRGARRSRTGSSRTRNPEVRRRVQASDPSASRSTPFPERRSRQEERLGLPALPTTTIGSFPQHDEVRKTRRDFRRGEIDREAYESFLQEEIERCIRVQEDAGVDVLVHGEFERNDMVEYFAERMEGFAFTQQGWVQSYGTRYVKPPILFGDVLRPDPITVRWWEHAAGCTDRPVKAILTGPVTMLQWSFVRDDQPRRETCRQLALAVRSEVADLEEAGAPVIQVDEPALREGLPLRRSEWDGYLEWAVGAFRLSTTVVGPETQIHTHMCYSEFNDIIEHIARMDADVLLIENARSDEQLLEVFRDFDYERDIGPGVWDIHSPRVPPVEEMAEHVRASLSVLPAGRLWVNPDCGLKTRSYDEVRPSLENMVEAARAVRGELEAEPAPAG